MDQNSVTRPLARKPQPGDWNPEQMLRLVELYNKGYSYGAIGNDPIIHKSRNAVAGQMHKLRKKGIYPLEARAMPTKRTASDVPSKPRVRVYPVEYSVPKIAEVLPESKRVRLKLIESPTAVTFAELGKCHCKFPIGDPRLSDFRFCGGQRLASKPYCADHVKLTEQPTLVRLRASRY